MMRFLKIMIIISLLSGCIASSKHVKQLDKIVEAQAEQSHEVLLILDSKGLLTVEQSDILIKNSNTIVKASQDQVKETASIFTWKTFSWVGFLIVLEKLGQLAKDFPIGGWAGLAVAAIGTTATWIIKNKQTINAIAENDLWHTKDKEKLVATVLTPKESTQCYDKNKEIACEIVKEHESKEA